MLPVVHGASGTGANAGQATTDRRPSFVDSASMRGPVPVNPGVGRGRNFDSRGVAAALPSALVEGPRWARCMLASCSVKGLHQARLRSRRQACCRWIRAKSAVPSTGRSPRETISLLPILSEVSREGSSSSRPSGLLLVVSSSTRRRPVPLPRAKPRRPRLSPTAGAAAPRACAPRPPAPSCAPLNPHARSYADRTDADPCPVRRVPGCSERSAPAAGAGTDPRPS